MSQVNLQESEISINERNSIIGSASLHNLTGTRARFQPVRIKTLLSLFDSEDDDTEPRDSDDNSDTESLQALSDDDKNDNNSPVSQKNEDPLSVKSGNKIMENQTGLSIIKKCTINEKITDNTEVNKSEKINKNDSQLSSTSNSIDSEISALPSSLRKSIVPFKRDSNHVDNFDNNKATIYTSQILLDSAKGRMYNQSGMLSDMKLEACQDKQINFDKHCKPKEPCYTSDMETPMKRGSVVITNQNSCLSHKKASETPQSRLNNEYFQSITETPGIIFSHWSRNNLLQTPTPTHNSIILSKKDGQINHQIQDIRLEPHKFCPSQNTIVRRPLSEATHVNQRSSISDNASNCIGEHHSVVKSNLLTKENCPMDSNHGIKSNVVDKIVQSSQESNRQCDINRKNLSALSMDNEKPNCRISLDMGKAVPSISVEKDYEFVSNKATTSDKRLLGMSKNGCDSKQHLQNNSEGILNLGNSNFEIGTRTRRSGTMLPSSNEQEINEPSPVDHGSNTGNVQFSVANKTADLKYTKTINVRGIDYLVLGKLGRGMSGEVLRVQVIKTGELRAIKCVDLSRMEKETAQGCLEEVLMLDKLRAPCVINLFTYEIKSHLLYVVMEMGDTDLSKLLKSMSQEKQLPLTMIFYYWTEMLTAVKHIHDHGVIHSDLKPANFLLVRGRLKLIDFGIASTVNADMTSVVKNTSVGTLNYISPEAINDIGGNGDSPNANNQYKINFKSDVWSLGCILYSMVYGQTPFQHIRATWAKVDAITNPNQKIAFPPPECTSRQGYTSPPPFLVDVMQRCLQHDRKARPSVSQLLQIPYVGCNCPPASSPPSIPPSVLCKIKHSLEESEWRQLLEVLEGRKPFQ